MESVAMFLTLFLMFFGALGAGILPFKMQTQGAKTQLSSRLMSALGAGLLMGSALGVIIPEGFHSLQHRGHSDAHDIDVDDHAHHHEDEAHEVPAGLPGLALIAGFLAMMLIEQAQAGSGHLHSHNPPPSSATDHHASSLPRSPRASSSTGVLDAMEADDAHTFKINNTSKEGTPDSTKRTIKSTATATAAHHHHHHRHSQATPEHAITGLLIHCAADGLAMGSAFLSGNAALSLVIATAMVLHKAPMAFGLGTYLIHCQWSYSKSQRTLLAFAAAAPVSTIVTYCMLRAVPLFTTPTAVALAVLFSGGTFLHAATMHILPEILGGPHGKMGSDALLAVGVGSLLPSILSWGHHH